MAAEKDQLPPLEPLHDRWEPNPSPSNIEVPGLDTDASVQDQIEQIEQLITIKLQNIDANFARAHQILSTKILPAVKRYAVDTEPVREAARFWVSFYEQAAQVRIPTTDDLSADREQQAAASDEEAETEQPQENKAPPSGTFDPNMTPSESSFVPESGAVSSTPMPQPNERKREATNDMWSESMESPLKRLNEGLKSLAQQEDSVVDHSKQASSIAQQSIHSDASSTRPPIFKAPPNKGKKKAQPPTYDQNVQSKNLQEREKGKHTSPLKAKKTPKKNPYVPPDIRRADWDGIVDLTKPATPRARPQNSNWSSDEEDFPPPDLSPPRSAFAKRIAPEIGRTPIREAAARIGRDLVDAERMQLRHKLQAVREGSLTDTASTPSLSMYSKRAIGMEGSEQSSSTSQAHGTASNTSTSDAHPSLDELMRRFGMDQERNSRAGDDSFDSMDDTPGRPVFANLGVIPEDGNFDMSGEMDSSFDDSFEMNPNVPSAAFLMASAGQANDDSFDNSDRSDDSLDADVDAFPAQPIHPFAKPFGRMDIDDGFDDSFDSVDGGGGRDDEPTVFGPQHAQRLRDNANHLQLLGRGLMEDTDALNSHLRRDALPETPTPWTGGQDADTL